MSLVVEGGAEEAAAKAVNKRYEGLVMVRNKAIKGKGAWYWAHLEPLLVHNAETGLAKAVKLKCCLCDTMFSASNPSRTASEHLKRGTCPNFANSPNNPRPLSTLSPPPPPHTSSAPPTNNSSNNNNNNSALLSPQSQSRQIQSPPPGLERAGSNNASVAATVITTPVAVASNHRKRSLSSSSGGGGGINNSSMAMLSPTSYAISPISVIAPEMGTGFSPGGGGGGGGGQLVFQPQPGLMQLAVGGSGGGMGGGGGGGGGVGGRDDLSDARGQFEDSIKRLKSPKASPGPALIKSQIDSALGYLGDWVFESCGSVSFSSLEHPKFKAFLQQVGMPEVCKKEFCWGRLDARYEEVRNESEARIRDAPFFQICCDGWKQLSKGNLGGFDCDNLVNLFVNLPNGSSVYKRALFTGGGQVPSKYVEEVLWETIMDICGGNIAAVQSQCVGIVADKFKNSALRNLEAQNPLMINLGCQFQAFISLIKDFYRELPLFKNVAENCLKLADFVNNKTPVRNTFLKYQMREYGNARLFRVPSKEHEYLNFEPVYAMVEDIMSSARVLQLVLMDDSYKIVSMEDPVARDFGEMIRDVGFWNDLDAVRSLVRLIKEMAHEFETERPLLGQCLPFWEELRTKVKDWCAKFHIPEGLVDKVIERRFRKNYHPAWAAAYILDPLYLIRDSSGKYLPPFKCLTPEQEKDVDKLITRLVSREEAHIALMELMKWRTEGLDPVYAQAVQLKQRDPFSGKMKIANPQGSRLVWETYLPEFKSLGKVAVRVIFLHATSRGVKCNSSFLKWVNSHGRSRSGVDRAQKMIFIAAHSKLDRRDFASEEDKDAELFASANGTSDSDPVGVGRPP